MGKPLQTYENDAIVVTFDPNVCIHSAVCLRSLPGVFDVRERRWVRLEGADPADIAATIRQCPSGALQYRFKDPGVRAVEPPVEPELALAPVGASVQVRPNGPLVIEGVLAVTLADGTGVRREGTTFLCRCGASQNKPYCDGAHKRVGFQG
jgi:uncharacterized Fe-S cluster protein YjdI